MSRNMRYFLNVLVFFEYFKIFSLLGFSNVFLSLFTSIKSLFFYYNDVFFITSSNWPLFVHMKATDFYVNFRSFN